MAGTTYGSDTDGIPTNQKKLYGSSGVPWWLSLNDGRYKYIRTLVPGEVEELYDLTSDPQELHNVAAAPDQRARLGAMRDQLIVELRRTRAGMFDHFPPVATLPETKESRR